MTHDLAVAKVLSDDVLVLRHGEIVEHAAADTFFASPGPEYSRHLLSMTFEPVARSRVSSTADLTSRSELTPRA